MTWHFENDRPIYLQIMDELMVKIISGEYVAGEKIPSVRELAAEIKVNPNTLQRAFSELEALNIIKTQRTSGRYVTEDIELLKELRDNAAQQRAKHFFEEMKQLGFDETTAFEYLKKAGKDDK